MQPESNSYDERYVFSLRVNPTYVAKLMNMSGDKITLSAAKYVVLKLQQSVDMVYGISNKEIFEIINLLPKRHSAKLTVKDREKVNAGQVVWLTQTSKDVD